MYPAGEIPLTLKSEEKEETVFYKLRMIPLASLEKTNKDLYDSLSTNLIEAVTTGKPSGADVIWNSVWVSEDINPSTCQSIQSVLGNSTAIT